MAGMNKIIIIGNLGRDPEMRYTPSGSAVTDFSVAVTRNWRSRDGENKEETDWFRVSCWDRLAEIANQYLSKGRQVYIEGRLKSRTYQDQNGETRVSLDINATELVLLGQRSDGQAGTTAGPAVANDTAGDLDNMPF